MKRILYFLGLVLILMVLRANHFAYIFLDTDIDSIPKLLKRNYLDELQQLQTRVKTLQNRAQGEQINVKSLRQEFSALRIQYKKSEYLLEYLDPQFAKTKINGAPLPKTEPKVPEIFVLQPKGLQVLDELIFTEDEPDLKEIRKQLYQLHSSLGVFIDSQTSILSLENRHILESTRQEIIRIFTLGLTGFDTPGSLNAIPEAIASCDAILTALRLYNGLPNKLSAHTSLRDAEENLRRMISYLKSHQDFNTLDRLYILKEFVNPIYAQIYDFHKAVQIEFAEEVDPSPVAVNYHAKNLFDENFLNIGFFSSVSQDPEYQDERIELGKILFFDPILSNNGKLACASCHQADKAFTDGLPRSKSNQENRTVLRNSPSILNSVYSNGYFWDLREHHLERQIKHVVMDSLEFDTDILAIIDKLSLSSEYQQLFEEAYPTYQLSQWSVTNALATYVANQNGLNSIFDKYVRGESDQLNESIKSGFNLFMGKASCGTCHFPPIFNGTLPPTYQDSESEVLGVPLQNDTVNAMIDPDLGRINSYKPSDEAPFNLHAFKTPGLRNVSLTGPYMHNGVFRDLHEVMDFYNRGGGAGIGIDLENQTLPDAPLDLNPQEIDQIISFMESLTDTTGLVDIPNRLPHFEEHPDWNNRVAGGSTSGFLLNNKWLNHNSMPGLHFDPVITTGHRCREWNRK